MILRFEFGKSRLWIGQPLVLSTQLEFQPSIDVAIPNPVGPMEIFLRGVGEGNDLHLATPLDVNLPPGVTVVETLDVAPGAYEVVAQGPWGTSVLPEYLWLLSRADYQALARSEAGEPFGIEPIVSTREELSRLLDHTVDAVWPGLNNPFEISWSAENGPISYSYLQWTTVAILNELKYVRAFGIANLSGFISISERLEVGVEVDFEFPIPDSIAETYTDEECSDLHLLNANDDLGDFDVDIDVSYHRGRIAVRQMVPEPEFA